MAILSKGVVQTKNTDGLGFYSEAFYSHRLDVCTVSVRDNYFVILDREHNILKSVPLRDCTAVDLCMSCKHAVLLEGWVDFHDTEWADDLHKKFVKEFEEMVRTKKYKQKFRQSKFAKVDKKHQGKILYVLENFDRIWRVFDLQGNKIYFEERLIRF